MKLIVVPYLTQLQHWPPTGRHILAQFDEQSIVVYQAYRPAIGNYAVAHGRFGGAFSFSRMSWIKPNFLWMMYRSGWGTKEGQEVLLAVWLKRSAFDAILAQAVHSSFVAGIYESEAAWKQAVAQSSVRLQWDPDHNPLGKKVERRAVQLGLRGTALQQYADEWILGIEDISEFVGQQRLYAQREETHHQLLTPSETVYPVTDSKIAATLGLSSSTQQPPPNSWLH